MERMPETPNAVKLILRNKIDERVARRNKASDEALNDAIGEALNDAERIIVEIIRRSPQASQKEIAEMAGFSRSKVQRIMKRLIENKIICREGARKRGIWRVIGE